MRFLTNKYTLIDLFAGCGGFSQGFLDAGFEVATANEFWEPAIETYKLNHEKVKFIEGDITKQEIKEQLYKTVNDRKINVIIGGPPCQGYSISGNRNPDDPRGKLYLDYINIVNHLKPDFFVMENVKGLKTMKHVQPNLNKSQLNFFKKSCQRLQRYKDLKRYDAQRDLDKGEIKEFNILKSNLMQIKETINSRLIPLIDIILDKFREIGYKVSWKVLNSANYGAAQTRERVILIGTKHNNIKIKFPEKNYIKEPSQTNFITHNGSKTILKLEKWRSAREVLERYENWQENIEKSHIFTKHSPEFIERLKNTPIGENVYKNYSDAWWRLDPEKPARTVKENHGGVFVHYKFNRVCTPRELAALQTFNDGFIFKGTKSAILKQIGNAVPPLMAKAIAEQIIIFLDNL